MTHKFKGIIFDLDGTLANTLGDLNSAINTMLAHYGLAPLEQSLILKHINHGAMQFVRGCVSERKNNTDSDFINEAFKVYLECYSCAFCVKTHAYEGITELCADLKNAGYFLAVLSNKQDKMTKAVVRELFGEKIFDVVLGGTHDIPSQEGLRFLNKPFPDSALWIAEKSGLAVKDFAYIGDSDVDMLTAANAGMFSVGVTWGFREENTLIENGANLIVRSAEELHSLFLGK